jgi:AmmeMemoRadiSam system protein A
VSELCDIAIAAINTALVDGVRCLPRADELTGRLGEPAATFVTLEREGRLLGCVGTLDAHQPLGVDVAEHALAAAFDDPRVPPVTIDDLPVMSVKVSVLSPPSLIAARSFGELRAAVRPGVDGITVEVDRRHRATLLPSVWEKVPDVEEFLDALWLKAGLRPRTWPRGIEVSRYTTTEECDPGPR